MEENGYQFRRIYREAQQDWVVEVRRQGLLVHRVLNLKGYGLDFPNQLAFGSAALLRGPAKQAVVRHWTGGGHCCNYYYFFHLEPNFGFLLDTSGYDFDELSEAVDLDGDGILELAFGTTTFDYFSGCYACSPRPLAWFQYDQASGRYLPANFKLFPYLKERQRQLLRKLPTLERFLENDGTEDYFRGDVLEIVLPYLYAGRDAEGWQIYEKRWPFDDKEEQRELIRRRLESDPFYQALRPTASTR